MTSGPCELPTDAEVNAVFEVADEYGVSRDVMHIALAKVHHLIAARVRAEERQGIAAEMVRRAEAADRADLASVGDALDVSECRHGHRADTYRAAARVAAGEVGPHRPPAEQDGQR